MVSALSKDGGGARGSARSSDSFLSRALGKSLRTMAGKHSGLVYQPSDLVGTSDTGLVPKTEIRGQPPAQRGLRPGGRSEVRCFRNLCRHRAATESGELGPGFRHPRHLVFVLALGLPNDGRRDAKKILS